ncbi:LysM repeat protein [Pullulanibacillus pueri]|uniref:LysM peptidoglycan-binding domain-containing protein n=1 Tax=Pullulanibacillus pueri TaxID=1437324 RepID=A0A8J3EJT2_9BACL|nr:LysM peptidoglycan-binding domain-containing protein [Pullulanibacillus pueri]MBM7680390.1 LysM repeat protein [Pullulanibacillus pueri]GGH75307.1 hypothetical protein GCM10007096_04400 [Pullulanibacillus pueri]
MKKVIPFAVVGGIFLTANGVAFASDSDDVIKYGANYLGTPYTYGAAIGDTSQFDCSSFTATVFKKIGINLPRTSQQQALVGKAVDKANLQKGDLVFFDTDKNGVIDHVGIYTGNNQMMSALVDHGISYSDITSWYWAPTYVTARRVITSSTQTANKNVQPTVSQTSTKSSSSYTVKSGDSLWTISQQVNLSIDKIKSLNHLQSDIIYPGQKLTLSSSSKNVTQTVASSSTKDQSSGSSYTVKSGDSLWAIAVKYDVSVSQIKQWNQLTSDVIQPGQKLSVKPVQLSEKTNTEVKTSTSKTSSTASKASTANRTYVVKKNDTLWDIAVNYKVSVDDIKIYNKLSSYIIFPGQKLKIPTIGSSSVKADLPTAKVVKKPKSNYTVKNGDTLWDIALLNDTSVKSIMKTNNLSTAMIFPGQVLVIPN